MRSFSLLGNDVTILPLNRAPLRSTPQPYFALAKSIGDSRAAVAEKGFGKPLKKVVVAASGVLE